MFPLTFWGIARELWPVIRDTVAAILSASPDKAARLAHLAAQRVADKKLADAWLETNRNDPR